MQHVAAFKLRRAGFIYHFTECGRFKHGKTFGVLQLVAESESTAALIKRCAGKHTADTNLIFEERRYKIRKTFVVKRQAKMSEIVKTVADKRKLTFAVFKSRKRRNKPFRFIFSVRTAEQKIRLAAGFFGYCKSYPAVADRAADGPQHSAFIRAQNVFVFDMVGVKVSANAQTVVAAENYSRKERDGGGAGHRIFYAYANDFYTFFNRHENGDFAFDFRGKRTINASSAHASMSSA